MIVMMKGDNEDHKNNYNDDDEVYENGNDDLDVDRNYYHNNNRKQ